MIFDTMLITGCVGDIAQTLARIARESGAVRRLIGCDIHENYSGPAFFDVCVKIPRADDSAYFDSLRSLIAAHGVNVIVPMSEAEIAVFLGAGVLGGFEGIPVIAANRLAVETGLDKFATFEMLSRNALGAPWTRIVGKAPPVSLPCILKPRRGQGSKGLRRVERADEVDRLTTERAGELWQELLLPDDEEYTCGLYRDRSGQTRTLVFKRRLQGGLTGSGEVVVSEAIESLLAGIAIALDLAGSINVQLRLTSEGPKVFEINPRFSSTVGFRHKLGFRDFIWSLYEWRGLTIESYCPPRAGTRIYRAANEIVIG